jgi:hypothetical protein
LLQVGVPGLPDKWITANRPIVAQLHTHCVNAELRLQTLVAALAIDNAIE